VSPARVAEGASSETPSIQQRTFIVCEDSDFIPVIRAILRLAHFEGQS
jgi:hypothetical protein